MSEYWKSTPKYWCKFCKTFVRDTAQEKKQHDATPRHQNNIQRSLRELHKGQERDDREKQRAKDEVARLNGLVTGKSSSTTSSGLASQSTTAGTARSAPVKATLEDRKRQMEQLAAMGVAVPDEHRRDLSIVGEWATVSETPIYRKHVEKGIKDEEDDNDKLAVGSFGVKKRRLDEDEDEATKLVKKNWGSSLKAYPGAKGNEDDLDMLLGTAFTKKSANGEGVTESSNAPEVDLKKEEPVEDDGALAAIPDVKDTAVLVKTEDDAVPPVVFKKRKGPRK